MLNEGRKRDAAANALLGLAFAASAAQSPKDLVRSGHIEGPGMQLMSRMMSKRKEANRNLDTGRVSHPARNVKKKTFKEFVEESYLIEIHKTKEDAAAYYKENPPVGGDPYYIRNKGPKKGWAAVRQSSLKKQKQRRSQKSNPLTKQELETHAKRTLRKNPSELADIALDREEVSKKKQTAAARRLTRITGTRHVQDHSQPLQQDKRRPENQSRFERVTPGDVASNLQVTSEPKNLKKGSKPPKKGERGYGTTRSGAVKKRLDKAQKFSDKMDKLIASVRANKNK